MPTVAILVIGVPTIAAVIAGFSIAARQLLGVRIGRVRAVLTGCVGAFATAAFGQSVASINQGVFLTVQFGCVLVVTMFCLAVSEVVLPSKSWTSMLRLPGALRRRVVRARRYSQISAIARRHGLRRLLRRADRARAAGPAGHPLLARSLRLALEEGGVTFVKLGQLLSTRYDVLPRQFIEELGQLQHKAAPAPWAQVEQQLRDELGAGPEAIFAEFDPEPLAAGSIAQVHRARLHSGQDVVVKVRRPGCRPVVEGDLDILCDVAHKLETRTRWGKALGLDALARGFATSLMEELDFRIEQRNMLAVAAAAAQSPGGATMRVPAVFPELCTEKVLVMEWLDGVTLGSVQLTADGGTPDRTALAETVLGCILRQIMVGGVFHADPHPGNILVLRDGSLGLLDFGSVGRIDALLQSALRDLLIAIYRADPATLCDALLTLVNQAERIDEKKLERALGVFLARHFSSGLAPDHVMFSDLFRLVAAHGLTVPTEIAAAFRALATLEGSLSQLAPSFDLVAETKAFAKVVLTEQLKPEALGRSAAEELLGILPAIRRFPRRVDRITSAMEQGRLSVNVRLLGDERDRSFVQTLVHEVILTVLGATTGVMGVLLLGATGGPRVNSSVTLFELFGYNLLVISGVLILRLLFTVLKARR